MSEIVAYACSTRPNALWSAAQFDNAAPKNREECDIPLIAKADLDSLIDERDRLREALEELRVAVFGNTPGDEPDVYRDFDRLSALHSIVRAALSTATAEGREP